MPVQAALTGTPLRWRDFRFVLDLPSGRGASGNASGSDPANRSHPAERSTPASHAQPAHLGDAAVLDWLEESLAGLCGGGDERECGAGSGGGAGSGESPPTDPADPRPGEPVHTYRLVRVADSAGEGRWVFERDGVVCLETAALARAAHDLVWQLGADALCSLDAVALHAGLLLRDGVALLLPAPSGSGKSTLVAALVQRGWAYGSDEAALLLGPTARSGRTPGAGVLAAGFPRPIWLDRSSSEALGGTETLLPPALRALDLGESHFAPGRLAPEARPSSRAQGDAAERAPAPPGRALEVGLVVFPRYARAPNPPTPTTTSPDPDAVCGEGWAATPLRPALALLELVANCFNLARFGQNGLDALAEVARRAPAYRLTHGSVGAAIEAIEALWPARGGPHPAPGAPAAATGQDPVPGGPEAVPPDP